LGGGSGAGKKKVEAQAEKKAVITEIRIFWQGKAGSVVRRKKNYGGACTFRGRGENGGSQRIGEEPDTVPKKKKNQRRKRQTNLGTGNLVHGKNPRHRHTLLGGNTATIIPQEKKKGLGPSLGGKREKRVDTRLPNGMPTILQGRHSP